MSSSRHVSDVINFLEYYMFSVSDPIQHFPISPLMHTAHHGSDRDTHIAGVDADIKIIFIFAAKGKWIFDDSGVLYPTPSSRYRIWPLL